MFIRSIVLAAAVSCSAAFVPSTRFTASTNLKMAGDSTVEDRRSFVTKVGGSCAFEEHVAFDILA